MSGSSIAKTQLCEQQRHARIVSRNEETIHPHNFFLHFYEHEDRSGAQRYELFLQYNESFQEREASFKRKT